MAEIGAVSSDMPYMAKALVKRLKTDPRVNFKKDWKLITLSIGGNDICSFVCLMKNPESLPKKHRVSLTKALRYLRDNLPRFDGFFDSFFSLKIGFSEEGLLLIHLGWVQVPQFLFFRTFVNVVSVPSVETVMLLKSKPDSCRFIHRGECSCWVGTINNVTSQSRQR